MELYGRAYSSKDRQLVVVEGHSHYELYDLPAATSVALDRLIPFFKTHLGETAASATTDTKVAEPAE